MANFDINALSTAIVTDNKWQVPVKIQRNHANPLDQTTLFFSKTDADTYAAGSLTKTVNGTTTTFNNAYPGQFIAVIENSNVTGYIIGVDRTLIELGSASSTGNVATDLETLTTKLNTFLSDEFGPLSSRVDGIEPIVANLSADENNVSSLAHIKKLISDEATTRDTNDKALSDDYIGKINALSVALSSEISSVNDDLTTEVQRAKAAEKVLSDAIDVLNGNENVDGSVSKAVKTAIDGIISGATSAYDTLKEIEEYISSDATGAANMLAHLEQLDTKTDTISSTLNTHLTAYANKMSELDTGASALSTRMNTAEANIAGLVAISADHDSRLTSEVGRATQAEAALKSDIDNKIFIDEVSASTLKVKHVSQEQYHTIVKSDEGADNNTIYVVSSDALNMFDEKIINLKAGELSSDAVNVGQLSAVSADLQGKIDTAVSNGIDDLSSKIFNTTDGLKKQLSDAIDSEASARSLAVQNLSTALSTDLSGEISRATTAERALSDRLDVIEGTGDGSVAKALADAKTYTNEVSTALSTDYVAKIGAEKSRAENVESGLAGRLTTLETTTVPNAITTANGYTNTVSAALSTDYTGKINALEAALTGNYVLKSNAEDASENDKLVKASTVDSKITTEINKLDATFNNSSAGRTVDTLTEVNGVISATYKDINITEAQVQGLTTDLTNRVLTANAEDATSSDKLVKSSTVNTRISNAVAALSVANTPIEASKTIASYKQENGKVTYTTQSIQIAETQVTNLTTHLNQKLETSVFDAYKNTVGLSAASSTNMVVTKNDIADLVGAMHFIGVKASTDEVTNPKAGDIVIVGTKEYVYGGSPARWHELGDEGIYLTTSEYSIWKAAVELSVANLSTAILNEATSRADNDTFLSNAITAINQWKDTTLETRLTGIESDINAEVLARTAITDALSDVNNTWKASVDLSVANLSTEIASSKAAVEGKIAAEVSRATAAEEAIDGRVDELSTYTHALSVSQIIWDVDVISCGSANM